MHSFKWLRVILFLGICMILTVLLNYALIPPNTVRINLHNLRNGTSYDTVFLGTSHGQYGIDPAFVDAAANKQSVSLCMADAYPDDMFYLLKLACETQKPDYVVYELDPSYWMNEQRSGSTEIFFFREFPPSFAKVAYFTDKISSLDFRSTLAPWSYYRNLYGSALEHSKVKQSEAYKNYDPSVLTIPTGHYGGRGFIYRDYVAGEEKGDYNHIPWDQSKVKLKALRYFERLVDLCREKDMELIVITTPVPQETWDHSKEEFEAAHTYFTRLLSGYGLEYYNFNLLKPELLDRSIEGYWDYDGHMNGGMAGQFSTLLGTFLNDLYDGSLNTGDYFN